MIEEPYYRCHCCGDERCAADDMALDDFWPHTGRMAAEFGGLCCKGCTDEYCVTMDDVLMRYGAATVDINGDRWSDVDALRAAWCAETGESPVDRQGFEKWVA